MRVAFTSACRLSAVTWRWPPSNNTRAKATRWRVGRRPAARKRLAKSGVVALIVRAICKQGKTAWKGPRGADSAVCATVRASLFCRPAVESDARGTVMSEREEAELHLR